MNQPMTASTNPTSSICIRALALVPRMLTMVNPAISATASGLAGTSSTMLR